MFRDHDGPYRTRVRLLGARRDIALKTTWPQQAKRREALLLSLDSTDLGRDVLALLLQRVVDMEEIAQAARDGDAGLQRLLRDAKARTVGDMDALLTRWLLTVAPGTRAQHKRQVARWVADHPRLSDLTADAVLRWLDALDVAPGTRWHYGVSLRTFVSWLTREGILPEVTFPLPRKPDPRTAWHDLPAVLRIVGATRPPWQAAVALLYGAGLEMSVVMGLRARDLDAEHRTVRAAGTKTWSRDRMARVEPWAWPMVEAHCRTLLPDAPLFPGTPKQLRYAHDQAQAACHLPRLTLHDARHSWAVRMLKAGVPLETVARQLGHKDGTMVLKVYGRFAVDNAAWERWEAGMAQAHEG